MNGHHRTILVLAECEAEIEGIVAMIIFIVHMEAKCFTNLCPGTQNDYLTETYLQNPHIADALLHIPREV